MREAAEAQRVAGEQSSRLVRDLQAAGLSGVESATVLGVSPQRVSQLLGGKKEKKKESARGRGAGQRVG